MRQLTGIPLLLGCLILLMPDAAAQQRVLVRGDSATAYLAQGDRREMLQDWTAPGFDDSRWSRGTRLEFPSGVVSLRTRTHFDVDQPESIDSLLLAGDYVGNITVWINGSEVLRASAAEVGSPGRLNHESRIDLTAAALPVLRAGENLLSIELWKDDGLEDDLLLDPHLLAGTASTLLRGPYLQSATPNGIVIRWRTEQSQDSRVSYGLDPGQLVESMTLAETTDEHIVTLSELQAATKYYYAVGNSDQLLAGGDAEHYFVTPPATGTTAPTRVWILGDSGTGNADAADVRDAYYQFSTGLHTDLWLMLGDNAYPDGTDDDFQDALFEMYPEMLRSSCLWPTLGNHDGHSADSESGEGPYFSIFTLPTDGGAGGVASGTEAYYSFDHANVHFVVLDSYDSDRTTSGPMLSWLALDLASTTQDWIVAYWHHPPYSKGSHDSDDESKLIQMRQNALPILESHGVDLVLGGHSHSYERSFQIHGHYDDSSTLEASMIVDAGDGSEAGDGSYTHGPGEIGTVYTVAGSSGKVSDAPLDHPAMIRSLEMLGSVVLEIDGDRLDALFLDDSGNVQDSYTIDKGFTPGDMAPLPPTEVLVY